MSGHTIATHRPKGHGHNDVRELQVRREDGGITVWLNTPKGPVLLRDRHLLDELTATLLDQGYGRPHPEAVEQQVSLQVGPDLSCDVCGGHGELVRQRFTNGRRWADSIRCPRCNPVAEARAE